MKKLLLIFALMFAVLTVKAQLPPLPSSNFKLISPYLFKYYTPYNSKVKSVWMNMGLTYGWMELLGYHRADSLFQQYRRLNDHDSLSTLQEKSYNSLTDKPNFGLYRLLTNHDSLSTLDEKSYNSLTDKPTIPDVSIYRRLNNHDSLNTLQEKSYNSLNDKPNLAIYRRNNDHDSLSTLQEKSYASLTNKPAVILVADTATMLSKYATDVNLTYKEDKSNKVTSISVSSTDIQYPSAKAVKTYADGKVADVITDGVTTIAPAENAVFDALALKKDLNDSTDADGYTRRDRFAMSLALKQNLLTNPVTGTGTQNHLPKWNNAGGTTLGNSLIYDNGTNVGIMTTNLYSGTNVRSITLNATDYPLISLQVGGTGQVGSFGYSWPNTYLAAGADGGGQVQLKTAGGKLTLLANGNVGIGTTTPATKLHVYGASPTLRIDGSDGTAILRLANAGTEQTQLAIFGGETYLDYLGGIHFRAGINGGKKVTILSGGNVGIGFTAPLSKTAINGGLHVGGESDAGDNNVLVDGSVTGASFIRISGTSTQCLLADGSVLNITVQSLSGTTVAWNVSSGINATLTLTDNTTITLSNLVAGTSGNIKITNPAGAAKTLTLAGYTNKISPVVYSAANMLVCSGASKIDVFSWWYDGAVLLWNGTNNYL